MTINKFKSGLSKKKQGPNKRKRLLSLTILILIVAGFLTISYFMDLAGITGLFFGKKGLIHYEQNLDLRFESDGEYTLTIKDTPEIFDLRSVKLSGAYIGDGAVRVYLEDEQDNQYLILDNNAIKKKENLASITGYEAAAGKGQEKNGDTSPGKSGDAPGQTKKTSASGGGGISREAREAREKEKKEKEIKEKKEKIKKELLKEFKVNKTEFIENITEENLTLIKFKDICVETCSLPIGLNATSYNLAFKVNGGLLIINKIKYSVKDLIKELNDTLYRKIKEDPDYDVIIDSADNSTGDLTVVFHHDSPKPLPIFIKGNIDYILDKNTASSGESITLTVSNWGNERFRIIVGEETEAFEFGTPKQLALRASIKNSRNQKINADIELTDSLTKQDRFEKTREEVEETIEEGEYDIEIAVEDHPVKKIKFKDIEVYEDLTELVDIDDSPETENFVEVYAIDPTKLNFTTAIVTATAKGNELYKCKEWDFAAQTCYGEWIFLQSIIPGQEYTFILTPEDPGLAEAGGTFFEGWESGNLATNNWTVSGTALNNWGISSSQYQGTYAIENQPKNGGEGIIETNVNTVNYQNIQFSFYTKAIEMDSGEYIAADWYNGTSWINIMQVQTIASYTLYNYSLPSSADNNANFKIRFRCTGDHPSEYCYVDNIQVIGTALSDSTPPASVTNLDNQSQDTTWIYWTWTNPSDPDFSQAIVYIDGSNIQNTSNNYYNATGFSCEETHNITVHTKDTSGNINTTNVIDIAATTACIDSTPPASVTNLDNQSQDTSWIYWTWTNPADPDFSQAIIYIDGTNTQNTSNNYYNATGLSEDTSCTITVHTKDANGNVNNTDINDTASTLAEAVVRGVSLTDPANQNTNRTVNAAYTITITNNGTAEDTYTLTVNNLNSASTAQLNQSSVTIAASQSKDVILSVTDDDTVGEYVIEVTVTSDNDVSATDTVSITTTVYGILSTYVTAPNGIPPPLYYEGQDITFQGYVYDEFNNAVSSATVTFEPISGSYNYICADTTDIGSGYYNCTATTTTMENPLYYDVRINTSKTYYHSGTFTNNSLFLLSTSKQANLTLYKLTTVQSLNDTTIVYNITNSLTNARGTSQSTNLTDPDAGQTWSLGNLIAQTVTRSYLLSFTRGNNAVLITLNKSNAGGYDSFYENNLFAESNQPTIVIPENETLKQITLVKNLVYRNQSTTNITYEIVIDVINSGDIDLEGIEITDTDINLDTAIDLAEGQSWQTSSNLLIQKNPQSYVKTFVKTRASASGDIFYSNQPNITIPGYGGPYDVIITSLPSSVQTGSSITGQIEAINQNTEVAEDRVLTTWIEDGSGNTLDIDVRTIYIGKGQSAYTSVTLTAPSSPGTYYFKSELVWPTATASATSSFTVTYPPEEETTPDSGETGRTGTAASPNVIEAEVAGVCGDGICYSTELQGAGYECLDDCGYDCNGDYIGDSWARCVITIKQIPDDLKQDIIILRNRANQLENEIEELKEKGAATQEAEEHLAELNGVIKEVEDKTARGEFDWARNLIKNAYMKLGTTVFVESPTKVTGSIVKFMEKSLHIPWKYIGSTMLIIIAVILIIGGVYYGRHQYNAKLLKRLKARRRKLENINSMIDNAIDKVILKGGS